MDNNKVLRVRNGRFIEVDVQVVRWQKRMRRFRRYQKLILHTVLQWHGGDAERAAIFLRAPHADLGNQSPKSFLNPQKVIQLYKWIKRLARQAGK